MVAEDNGGSPRLLSEFTQCRHLIREKELSAFSQPEANFNQHWSCHHWAALAVTPRVYF